MKLSELMTRGVRTCTPNDTLETAARIMWERDCGAVPVVDDGGRAIAIVTDRDACMAAFTQGRPLFEIPVSTAASKQLFALRPDDTIDAAERLMIEKQIRRLPVLDDDRRPIGIVCLGDIARHHRSRIGRGGVPERPIVHTLAAVSQPRGVAPVYRVKSVDAAWGVFDAYGARLSERLRTQGDAVAHAKELARRDGAAHVVVEAADGAVVSEFFHQREEREALAHDDSVPMIAASQPAHAKQPRA